MQCNRGLEKQIENMDELQNVWMNIKKLDNVRDIILFSCSSAVLQFTLKRTTVGVLEYREHSQKLRYSVDLPTIKKWRVFARLC